MFKIKKKFKVFLKTFIKTYITSHTLWLKTTQVLLSEIKLYKLEYIT
jgi:hypothetical protein